MDNVKDSKSLSSDDSVWFTTHLLTPNELSPANPDNNPIINNWAILPNDCIQGQAYKSEADYKAAPDAHQRINTHGVSKNWACNYH